ncbi:MAG TPA: hypothetical protein VHF86_10265 [Xanthomonadaceae bacterium]|nr:hypothetical protein [Xanthomonadaceae bacterium]
MAFLTDAERRTLKIDAMILHVVGQDPFVPEPARTVEHAPFFIARILDTDVSAVHSFEDDSATRTRLERMARSEEAFDAGAQALSREFSRLHGATTREGAFFIFALVTDDPRVRLYSLIKYDYREAIEQTGDDRHLLRRIVHAFIDDRKAIQKSALVRIVDGRADPAVAAHDRVTSTSEISDYFAAFLGVRRTRSDRELNAEVAEVLRRTLQEARDVLPDHDVARALHHAKAVLRDRQQIHEEAIADAVLSAAGDPRDDDTRTRLLARTTRKLETAKLGGLVFPPDREVLERPPLRRLRTVEGVVLSYPDEADPVTVRRERTGQGGEVITITTDHVLEDRLVPDHLR